MSNTDEIGLAKNAVPGTILRAPGFATKARSARFDREMIRYEGDSRPRMYRGDDAAEAEWSVQLLFNNSTTAQTTHSSIMDMLDDTQTDADGRLILWPGTYWSDIYPAGVMVAFVGPVVEDILTRPSGIRSITLTLAEVI